jgi:hypothetical protein
MNQLGFRLLPLDFPLSEKEERLQLQDGVAYCRNKWKMRSFAKSFKEALTKAVEFYVQVLSFTHCICFFAFSHFVACLVLFLPRPCTLSTEKSSREKLV